MRALVLAVALLGSATATAQADTTQPGSYVGGTYLDAGPVLVGGDRIAWASERSVGGNQYVTRLYSAPIAGGDVTDHGQVADWTDEDEYSEGTTIGTLAGGNGNLAWLTYGWSVQAGKFGSGYFNHQISTLTRDGKLTKVCGPGELGTMSLTGDTLGISGCGGVTVRDLSRPDVAPAQVAPTGGWTQVAGTYVAWWTDTGFELLDRATGTRTTLDTTQLAATRRQFALSPEGVLVLVVAETDKQQVVWASPSEPTWHTIALPGLDYGKPIRLRGNRLAYMAYHEGLSQLWVTDLAGTAPTLLAERGYTSASAAPYDFDGTTFTWGASSCGALTVIARPIAAGKLELPNQTHCPVVVADRASRGKIRLRCPAPSAPLETDRCKGTVTVTRNGRKLGSARFNVKVYRAGSARIKSKPRGRVKVTVRSVTRGRTSTTKATVEMR